jgi:L-iditol 2-dehydrogenase
MTATMSKAAVVREFGVPIEVEEVPVPEQIEPGALLVEIEVASMCGSDVHLWDGALGNTLNPKLPCILGHEMVGKILEFGDGPKRDSMDQELKEGDRVVFTHASCGRCYQCLGARKPSLCPYRKFYQAVGCTDYPYVTGGFSQYCYVFPNSGRIRVPDGVKSTWATAASCAMRTSMQGLRRAGKLEATETIAIQGSGPLGLFATAIARMQDPAKLIVIGAPDERLDVAREFGADEIISIEEFTTPESRVDRVKEVTRGLGADVLMEVSGAAGAFYEGIRAANRGARYIVIGQVGGDLTPVPAYEVTHKQLDIRGVWSAEADSYYLCMLFLDKYKDRFDWDKLTSNHYSLEQMNDAIASMKVHAEIKPMIFPNGELN